MTIEGLKRTGRIVALAGALAVGVCAVLPSRVLAGDWPAYKHDLSRTSVTDETLSFPMREAWRYMPVAPPSPAWPDTYELLNRTDFDYAPHPIVAGGQVFIASSSDDTVRALDASTGAEKWHFTAGGPVRIPPQFDSGKVYFGSDDGYAYCVDAATGKLAWRFHAAPADERMIVNHRMASRWPVRSGVLVSGGVAYFVAGLVNMEGVYAFAVAADTGKLVWRNDSLGFIGVTIVDFPESEDPEKQQVGGHNGEFAANAAIGANPQGAMLLFGDQLIIPNTNSNVTVLDKRTGAVIPAAGGAGGTWLTIDKGVLFSYTRHREDVQSVKATPLAGGPAPKGWGAGPVPQVRIMPPKKNTIVHDSGKVSSIVSGGKLYARHAFGVGLSAGTLLVGDRDVLIAQDPDTERVLWRAAVEGEPREIAIANGKVFVGTSTGAVYCFEPAPRGGNVQPPAVVDAAAAIPAPAQTPTEAMTKAIEQLATNGMDRGIALVVGDPDGKAARELAARTSLRLVVALPDAGAVSALREKLLTQTRWYGTRIQIEQIQSLEKLPFAQYFANAVIVAGKVPESCAKELYRVTKPCGGQLLLPGLSDAEQAAFAQATGAPPAQLKQTAAGSAIVRDKLPGALDWDSPYRLDQRVKWPLRPLWIGGPSTEQIRNIVGGSGPIVANGRYFLQGEQSLTAVDAYNGEVLWTRSLPRRWPEYVTVDGVVYPISEPGKYAREDMARTVQADNNFVYLVMGSEYFQSIGDDVTKELEKTASVKSKGDGRIQIDARTGEQVKLAAPYNPSATYSLAKPQKWSVDAEPKRPATVEMQTTEKGVQITLTTLDALVSKLDSWELCFDFRPVESRYGLFGRGTFVVRVNPARDKNSVARWSKITGEAFPEFEVAGTREPNGTKTTVLLPWAQMEKLVGSRPENFGFGATLSTHNGSFDEPIGRHYLFCDWTADGLNNGWACIVLSGDAPSQAKKPAMVIDAFPRMPMGQLGSNPDVGGPIRDLPRVHPLTGDLEPKMYRRGGCGGLSSSSDLRSGSQSLYDFEDDSGMRPMGGVKARCSTPQVIALGLLIFSEEAGHCVCPYPLRTTMVMAPAERRLNEDWAFYFDRPVDTIVRTAAINFGAPGDRRDSAGSLWLGYPRIPGEKSKAFPLPAGSKSSVGANGVWLRVLSASLQLPLEVECLGGTQSYQPKEDLMAPYGWMSFWSPGRMRKDFGPFRVNADVADIRGTDRPWIYASGVRGVTRASMKLEFLKPLVSKPVEQPPVFSVGLEGAGWGEPTARLKYTHADVFLRHDKENLYIAARRPAVINRLGKPMLWLTGAKGDDAQVWQDDSFEVFLSSGKSGPVVHLGVSCSGAKFDALATDSRAEDVSWNTHWTGQAKGDSTGLAIMLTVPWKSLEAAGISKDQLGINVQMNQRDTSGEPVMSPGSLAAQRGMASSGEALSYLGYLGRQRCENFAAVGLGEAPPSNPRYYHVKLHFVELDGAQPGQRVFDVKLQDQLLLKDFDIAKEAGQRTALVKEFAHVPAADAMKLEFVPAAKDPTITNVPVISAMEVYEEGFTPPTISDAPTPKGK